MNSVGEKKEKMIARLNTREMRDEGIPGNFILFKRVAMARYFYCKSATYFVIWRDIKGNNRRWRKYISAGKAFHLENDNVLGSTLSRATPIYNRWGIYTYKRVLWHSFGCGKVVWRHPE